MQLKKYLDYFLFIGKNWNFFLATFTVYHEIKGERKYKLDTTYINNLKQVEVIGENKTAAYIYQPVNYYMLERAFAFLKEENISGALVDFGCGFGRILIVAANFGYTKITGVEFVPLLCNEARKNIQKAQTDFPETRFEIFCGDAIDYNIQKEENIFTFFNPFDERVMLPVVKNILKSIREFPRKISVVYFNPTEKEIFLSAGFEEIFYLEKMKYLDVSILMMTPPGIDTDE